MYIFFSAFWALGSALMPVGHLAAALPVSDHNGERRRNLLVWGAIVLILLPLRLAVNVSL